VATRNDGAVVITNILDASESYRRGIRQDDELVSFATRPIRSVNQFKNILGIYPKGWMLPIVYRREGDKKEVWVRLRGLHRQSELTGETGPKKPEPPKRGKNDPKQPDPPRAPVAEEDKPPEQYKQMFAKRAGFANYYFNELERTRVMRAIASLGDFSQAQGPWKLAGSLNGKPIEITAADSGIGLISPDPQQPSFLQQLDDSAKFTDEPPSSGGLLLAMHHLRQMCTKGKNGFSEFYYLGSEPFDGTGERVDVLVCELTGAESWWYFSREKGTLLGFDLYRNEEVDSCEIRIAGFGEFSGRTLPNKLTVTNGDKEFGKLEFATCQFLTKSEEKQVVKTPEAAKTEAVKPEAAKPEVKKPTEEKKP